MDSNFLINLSSTIMDIIIIYGASELGKTVFTLRQGKPKSFSKIIEPPKLVSNFKFDNMNIEKSDISLFIRQFEESVTKNFKKDDLNNFYNNLTDLKFKKNNIIMSIMHAGGLYTFNNSIIVDSRFFYSEYNPIYHELFHMLSSMNDGYHYFSGFHYHYGTFSVGNGLNEGYTELLASRYFYDGDLTGCSYKYLIYFSKLAEDIVGKEKMQSLYANSNLNGLILELSKYSSVEEVMRFIAATDFIASTIYRNTSTNGIIKKKLYSSFKNTYLFLINSYGNKLDDQIDIFEKTKKFCLIKLSMIAMNMKLLMMN